MAALKTKKTKVVEEAEPPKKKAVMTIAEAERLFLLAEEAAEVIQVVNKILRHGYDNHNPNDEEKTPNYDFLKKEITDFYAVASQIAGKDIPKIHKEDILQAWKKK